MVNDFDKCSADDFKAHTICCQNLLDEDHRRKWKKGDKELIAAANRVLAKYVTAQKEVCPNPREKAILVEVTSKMMEYRLWYEDPNIPPLPEVD